MSSKRILMALLAAPMALGACGHVHSVWQPQTLAPVEAQAKRIAVAAWAPAAHAPLAAALQAVANDYVKLRKDYLVYSDAPQVKNGAWQQACASNTDAVLWLRALDVAQGGSDKPVYVHASAQLLRCRDGALLYRSEGALRVSGNDKHLREMRAHYQEQLGASAGTYVPAAFVLLQELLAPLPQPVLTDADIEEKIELGALDEAVAPRA